MACSATICSVEVGVNVTVKRLGQGPVEPCAEDVTKCCAHAVARNQSRVKGAALR